MKGGCYMFDDEDKNRVLIVDDEQSIIDILVYNLKKEGYNTIEANDGQTAVDVAIEQKPDLILLDIMLPKMDGLTACKKIKSAIPNVPILILSAKDEELDKIVGLELGADDYITKPFSVRELMARVKANLRKTEILTIPAEEKDKKENHKITVGDLSLDIDRFEVKVRGEKVDLTVREFEALKYLAQQPRTNRIKRAFT